MTVRSLPGFAGLLVAFSGLLGSGQAQDEKPRALAERTLTELKQTVAEILSAGEKPTEQAAAERDAALRRLKVYRYLAGVPYENLQLDDDYCKKARAGARLCEQVGRLDHHPENPGLPPDEYQMGVQGTSSSNLAEGFGTLSRSIDGWMDDSNATNIDRLGHRRWCLSPWLEKTGFGRVGKYSAMYIKDHSNPRAPDFEWVAFPPPGLVPVEYFGQHWAWHVSLNPRKYRPARAEVKPVIWEVDREGKKLGRAFTLNAVHVNNDAFGIPICVIFRPERLAVRPGKRYRVELTGLQSAAGQPAADIAYTVEFVSVH